jgi:hypothetical protein
VTMRFNHENGLSCLVLECGLPHLMRCVGSQANYAGRLRSPSRGYRNYRNNIKS